MYCSNCGSDLGNTSISPSVGRRSKAGKYEDRGTEDNTDADVGEIDDDNSDEDANRPVSPENLVVAENALKVFLKLMLLAVVFFISSLMLYILGGRTTLNGDISMGTGILVLFVILWAVSFIFSNVFTSGTAGNFTIFSLALSITGFFMLLAPDYGAQGNILQPAPPLIAAMVTYFSFCVTLASSIIYLRVKKIGGALDSGRLSMSPKHKDRN